MLKEDILIEFNINITFYTIMTHPSRNRKHRKLLGGQIKEQRLGLADQPETLFTEELSLWTNHITCSWASFPAEETQAAINSCQVAQLTSVTQKIAAHTDHNSLEET